jgi:hypothetical protein
MKNPSLTIAVVLFIAGAAASAAAQARDPAAPGRRAPTPIGGGMQFGVRAMFIDPEPWNALVPRADLPRLPIEPPIMHGGIAYVNVNDWFRAGLQGYGMTHGATNGAGLTELAAGFAGFFADARYAARWGGQAFAGATVSCGRMYFNSIGRDGIGLRASSGAIYVEPYLGIGYTFFKFLETRLSASYMLLRILEGSGNWYGPGAPRAVNPDGLILTLSLGYPLPSEERGSD